VAHFEEPSSESSSVSISLKTRLACAIGIAPEGVSIALPVAAVGVVIAIARFHAMGIALIIVAAALGAFFRDPERQTPAIDDAVISGADGRISDIRLAPIPGSGSVSLLTRISVFMSPLDVHVNRASVFGHITALEHAQGEFRAAFRDTASEHNERNLIIIRDRRGRDHALVQVAGYLARRIVCYLQPHQPVQCGQRIGLIMFGSRVDHFVPLGYKIVVAVGDRVRAGETVIGESPND
jgi:phosphatidylserine decarboxylase